MAPKPSHDTLIHCEACGEDYSSTYRSCPFCGARNAPRRTSGRDDPKSSSRYIPTPPAARDRRDTRDELDDTYIFDGQDAFDEEPDEDYYTPRPKGGKRLAPKEGGSFDLPPVNWPRLITFLCSLIIIVAALIIVFTYVYPMLHKDPKPDSSGAVSMVPSSEPSPSVNSPEPAYTDPVEPSLPVDPVTPPPTVPVTTGTPATVVNASGGLRLRAGPGTTYEILGSLKNGDAITVLAPADNGWYNITYNGVNGYIMGDYISTINGGGTTTTTPPPAATNPPSVSTQTPSPGGNVTTGRAGVIVNAEGGLRVRSGPGTTYEVVDSLFNNNPITVVSDAGGGWYQIQYAGSGGSPKTGYIMGDYISTN